MITFLPNDFARCAGVGSQDDDGWNWREGCDDCLRRTSERTPYSSFISPPVIIVFECEFLISPDGGSDQRPARRCVTHHSACDCREALMAESMETQRRVIDWRSQSDEGLRLRFGYLSAEGIRAIRAVLSAILPPTTQPSRPADNA